MKKSIQGSSLNSMYPRLASFIATLVLILGAHTGYAQVDCNATMACNDGVQVSLDDNCEAFIAPDLVLEDPLYDDSEYTVVVMMPDGTVIPGNIVTSAHIGMTLEVNIILTDCGNSCWGNINIEDKLPPVITNCADITVDCDDNINPGQGVVPFATAVDACGGLVTREYVDNETILPCAAAFVKTVVRSWTFTDRQGNEAVCEQTISVTRADITSIMFPRDYDDIELPSFSCGDVIELLPNGAPSPNVTGRPEGASCPNIQVYYDDVIFDICGASKKILRKWLVLDWCTGEERTENQIIKILDEIAPICTSQPDFIDDIATDQGKCTGTYNVPPPIVIFECSEYKYTVAYKLRGEDGNPFEDPIQDNVTKNFDGSYTISGLPQDTTWIIYTLTDECDNESQCFTEVFVSDQEAPTPVCEGYTVVSLEDQGWADVFATSIDDGSYDNCEVVRFEVKRETTPCGFPSDLNFSEKVNFCCEDVGNGYVKVVMRAFDAAGNFNDCIVNVTVQDKINPTITCPANVTIQCDQDYEDLSLTGTAVAQDNCSAEVTYQDSPNLNDCGLGTIRRTWTATDKQGRKATCIQIITSGDGIPFSENNIQWPADREEEGCDANSVSPEAINSRPILTNTDCADIAISYKDDVFYSVPDYCLKVLRHWKVADWCSGNGTNQDYYEYTQKIGIYNNVRPIITSDCTNKSVDSEPGDCEAQITETVEATDDCTPGALLKYSYTIDLDNNGSVDVSSNGQTINGTYPSGTHRITWEVEDACENVGTCSYLLTINDNKAPTPICLGSVTWVLDADGKTEIWASDFNLKSEDTCDDEEDLRYSFNAAGTQPALEFTCADIPNGIAESIPLQMYVIDSDGNSEYCDVILELQDNGANACEDVAGAQGRISGMVMDKELQGIDNIAVELKNMDSQGSDMKMTEEGEYLFNEITHYDEYSIEPYKNDDIKNGVNTLDLVKIQRHILGLEALAVKVGDVDGNAIHGLQTQGEGTALAAVAPKFGAGEIFTVDFRANEVSELVGMQFTIDFDADALDYSTIKSGLLDMSEDNIGLEQSAEGYIAISWNDINALSLHSEDILFSVTFKAKKAGELSDFLAVSSALVDAQSYDAKDQTQQLSLAITNEVGDS